MAGVLSSDLLTTEEAAGYLNTSKATLETWRCTKAVNLPFVRLGRAVRYRRSELDRWLQQNTQNATGANREN
jgi:excisionase family DNA binding protein